MHGPTNVKLLSHFAYITKHPGKMQRYNIWTLK